MDSEEIFNLYDNPKKKQEIMMALNSPMLCAFWRQKVDPGHNASQKKLKRHEIGTALEVKPEQGRMCILEVVTHSQKFRTFWGKGGDVFEIPISLSAFSPPV